MGDSALDILTPETKEGGVAVILLFIVLTGGLGLLLVVPLAVLDRMVEGEWLSGID